MRKSFIFLFAATSFLVGCTTSVPSNNSNQSNAASTPTPVVETNQANTNTAKVEDTPLPIFTDAETALAEGKKLLDANKNEQAVEALKQAVKLNPDLAEAYFNLGVAQALIEKVNEQIPVEDATPEKTVKKGKNGKDALILTESDKSFDNAAKAYEKIIKKNPKDDNAYFNLGRAYNKLNKDEESSKALRQAVKLKPDDAEYQTELGAILIKLAKYDDAVIALKKALSLDAENSHAQDLMDKAEAGQKRINFGAKPKSEIADNSGKQKTTTTAKSRDSSIPTEQILPKSTPSAPSTPSKPVVNKKGV